MVKKEFDEEENFDDFEEDFEEDEEEEKPSKKPIKQIERSERSAPPIRPKQATAEKNSSDRYAVYHLPQIDGIRDVTTDKLLTNDMWEALAIILNKLERLEEGFLGK